MEIITILDFINKNWIWALIIVLVLLYCLSILLKHFRNKKQKIETTLKKEPINEINPKIENTMESFQKEFGESVIFSGDIVDQSNKQIEELNSRIKSDMTSYNSLMKKSRDNIIVEEEKLKQAAQEVLKRYNTLKTTRDKLNETINRTEVK